LSPSLQNSILQGIQKPKEGVQQEMKSMSQVESIRQMAKMGKTVKTISRELHADYRTVKKYIEQEDFNIDLPGKGNTISKLDSYKPEINRMLKESLKNWHKQQLTAKRVCTVLKEKHIQFTCSYSIVQRYVKEWKVRNMKEQEAGFNRLVWHEGEAQADFGEADFIQDGQKIRYKYFILSFPYSNKAYCQIYGGENCECVCQALLNIFIYIGGVPEVIVFDNATGIGRRICNVLKENEMFVRFRQQYRFESRFCNPNSGHEKGNVEANVGYVRRNLFTPLITIPHDVETYNRTELFSLCENLMADRMHYLHKVPVNELFEQDKKALLELPGVHFKARKILQVKTNGYAEVVLDNIHRYTMDSNYRDMPVLVETWPWTVKVYDAQGVFLEEFEREYSEKRTGSIHLKTCINNVVKKPGSWPNSIFRSKLSDGNPFVQYMDGIADIQQKKMILRRFKEAMNQYDYETVRAAFTELALRKADMTKSSNVTLCCCRAKSGTLNTSRNPTGVDLNKYSRLTGFIGETAHEN
jgi:transposase